MFALPKFITEILDTLHTAGYEAYVVGGAVRDLLLGETPSDFDITTSCPPDITTTLFEKTVNTGIKHGTVTVVTKSGNVEVTTYRRDLSYTDHRKPDGVDFVSNLFEDLKRRDFTVNAMALSKDGEIIDEFYGQSDLKNKIIRAVGNANERFLEDALRILRAFRFSARLNFDIEGETLKAAMDNAHLLSDISCERIFAELKQILLSDYPEKAEPLINCGGLSHLNVYKVSGLEMLKSLPKELPIRFYGFCELADCEPETLCRSLKSDNNLLNYCLDMRQLKDMDLTYDTVGIKTALKSVKEQVLKDSLLLPSFKGNTNNGETLAQIDAIINSGEPYLLSQLKVGGEDIKKLSVDGKDIGKVLDYLLIEVINHPELNEKSKLINLTKEFIKTQFTIKK